MHYYNTEPLVHFLLARQADWNGKFKITFQTPDLTITVPEGSYSPPNLAAAVQNKRASFYYA